MPFGLGWPELTIILVIVLVLFGASRVPEVGRALGKGIREFKSSIESRDDSAKESKAETKSEEKTEAPSDRT